MSGVSVEVELGRIKRKGIEGEDFLVDVEEVVQFVRETEVNSLAVGIGTAHGFYTPKPELNFQHLSEVNKAIQTPLVLRRAGQAFPMRILKSYLYGNK
ncbi:MAG: hypothetical protein DRQ02_10960 [Candidatus Latescibacterota bacterium]|nr:MAG: hypothetical protein DRQ02_10960 [Candidatus Latescibacterota bacterium]HDG98528.1 hypothetical protein [Desulfobacterales bacterium]